MILDNPRHEVFTCEADANHPLLNHHRPMGLPLFGTALGFHAMLQGARNAAGGKDVRALEQIEVLAPLILAERQQTTVRVMLEHCHGNSLCLTSPAGVAGAPPIVHFRACFAVDEGTVPNLSPGEWPSGNGDWIPGSWVYQTFFHGPAYQVIERARLNDGVLTSILSPKAVAGGLPIAALLLEFAMQTSGALDLIQRGSMRIPKRISRARLADFHGCGENPLLMAQAHRIPGTASTNIAVFHSDYRVALVIEGFEMT